MEVFLKKPCSVRQPESETSAPRVVVDARQICRKPNYRRRFDCLLFGATLSLCFAVSSEAVAADKKKSSAKSARSAAGSKFTSSAASTSITSVSNETGPHKSGSTGRISGLTLISSASNQDLQQLVPGAVINLAELPSSKLNIRADADASVSKVVFQLNNHRRYRDESSPPFSLAGDRGGKYEAWTPGLGLQKVIATPYRNGVAGTPFELSFTVVNTPTRKVDKSATALIVPISETPEREPEHSFDEARGQLSRKAKATPSPGPVPQNFKTALGKCMAFVSSSDGQLTVACSHTLPDAKSAAVLKKNGGKEEVICEFLNAVSPIVTSCANSPEIFAALQEGHLFVNVLPKLGKPVALPVVTE